MRLASGIIRLPALHQAGVKVGLGLDGGTNDTSDMFNTMRVAVGLQRATSLQASVFPTVSEVLRMATLGGAEVLDMAARIGSLTPGKQADVLILDPGRANFAPRLNWINQLVFNGQPANVDWVFVDGQPLKAGGRVVRRRSSAHRAGGRRGGAKTERGSAYTVMRGLEIDEGLALLWDGHQLATIGCHEKREEGLCLKSARRQTTQSTSFSPHVGAPMPSKTGRFRKMICARSLRRRVGRHLPSTSNHGPILWRPRSTPSSFNKS